jgi:hypothetical protein
VLVALLVSVLVAPLLLPSSASADFRGFTWNRGTLHGGLRFASDDLDLGVGAGGGYTLGQGVYLGGLFAYYFADDDSAGFGGFGVEADWDVWFLMFEGGYDFGVTPELVLRPTFAIGVANTSFELCADVPGASPDCTDDSDSDMEAALGGHVLYDLGGVYLGGELRLIFGDFDGAWLGFNVGGVL